MANFAYVGLFILRFWVNVDLKSVTYVMWPLVKVNVVWLLLKFIVVSLFNWNLNKLKEFQDENVSQIKLRIWNEAFSSCN